MKKEVKLIYVSVEDGKTQQSNKFYHMSSDGTTITVEYGRVGANSKQTETYPVHLWDKKYKEKLKKGYIDVTELHKESLTVGIDIFNIPDLNVKELIKKLHNYSKNKIADSYTISSRSVTVQMVEEAQKVIDSITTILKINVNKKDINDKLLYLYKVIPRKMKDVRNHLIDYDIISQKELEASQKFIEQEQELLNVMKSEIDIDLKSKVTGDTILDEKNNILSILGIEVSYVTDKKEIDNIKRLMGNEANYFDKAYKVTNHKSKKKYQDFVATKKNKKQELFWHGSRSENWLSILENSLVLRPNAVISGKMFGEGIYGASKFSKSLGYTSFRNSRWAGGNANEAFLALYNFHVGNQLEIPRHGSWCYDLNETNLKKKGNYDSVFAVKGADLVNDEFIVYNDTQVDIEYLIQIKG